MRIYNKHVTSLNCKIDRYVSKSIVSESRNVSCRKKELFGLAHVAVVCGQSRLIGVMATRCEVEHLAVNELCDLLSQRLQDEVGEATLSAIRENRVNGRSLLELTERELAELVPLLGDRKAIKRFIDSYTPVRPEVCQHLTCLCAG